MKFALVSHVLPPMWSGQSVMLYRLLCDLSPSQYCLISSADCESYAVEGMPTLPGNYYRLPPEFRISRGHRFGLKYVRESVNALTGIAIRGRRIAQIIKREKCDAVVACSGDLFDL